MSENHAVRTFAFEKPGEEAAAQLKRELPQQQLFSMPLQMERSAGNYLRSLLLGMPLSVYRNYSREAKALIAGLAADCDTLVVDHYLMFQYVPAEWKGRVVIHTHNAEYVLWERYASGDLHPLKRLLVQAESRRIRRVEAQMLQHANAVLASPNDSDKFLSIGAQREKLFNTLHLGDDSNLQQPDLQFADTKPVVSFVGTLTWEANLDGLLWFVRRIWPSIVAQVPEAEFCIVGKCKDEAALTRELATIPGVRYLGFVDDLEAVYKQSRVFVAPLRFGAGTKVKVVNALYRGIPTVTTDCGVEGLQCESTSAARIANDPDLFAREVVRLLSDQPHWEHTRRCARDFASAKLSWSAVLSEVEKAILHETRN